METNNNNTTTKTFPWPEAAQRLHKTCLDLLGQLGYEGPTPKTYHEANVLIEDLLRAQAAEESAEICNDYIKDFDDDGCGLREDLYARMMRLRWKGEQK